MAHDFASVVRLAAQHKGTDAEFRMQPNSETASKKDVYIHSGKSAWEVLGRYKTRRATKRLNGANHISNLMDRHYNAPGIGAEVLSRFQQRYDKDVSGRFKADDVLKFEEIGNELVAERNQHFVEEYFRDGEDFMAFVNNDLGRNGTAAHPFDDTPLTWTRLAQDLKLNAMRASVGGGDGNEQPNKMFTDFMAAVTAHARRSREPVTADAIHAYSRTYFDTGRRWKERVMVTSRDYLIGFSHPSVADRDAAGMHYVRNVVGLVDEWYADLEERNVVGSISESDRDWLKSELGRMNDRDMRPEKPFRKDYHLAGEELGDFFDGMMAGYNEDARALCICDGDGVKRASEGARRCARGIESKRIDIVHWHDRYFRELLTRRTTAQQKSKAAVAEKALQGRASFYPSMSQFINHTANRGRYENLGVSRTDSLARFIGTWLEETGIAERLRTGDPDSDAVRNLEKTLDVLDRFADFARQINDVLLKHDGDVNKVMKSADSKLYLGLTREAELIYRDIDGFQELRDLIGALPASDESGRPDPVLQATQDKLHDLLHRAFQQIMNGVSGRIGITPKMRARRAQHLLMQLPHVQKLRNDFAGNSGPATANEMPSQVVSLNLASEIMSYDKKQSVALEQWKKAVTTLDDYAEFANEHGARLMDLEHRHAGKALQTASEIEELKRLQSRVRQLDSQIATLAKHNSQLRSRFAKQAEDPSFKSILDAVDTSVVLMKFRMHGQSEVAWEDENKKHGFWDRVAIGHKANELEVRSFVRDEMSATPRIDLENSYCAVLAVAEAMNDERMVKNGDDAVDAALESLPKFANRLRVAMRSVPVPQARDPELRQLSLLLANGQTELERLRDDLAALRKRVETADAVLPISGVEIWPGRETPTAAPANVDERREVYLAAIDQLDRQIAEYESIVASKLADFATYGKTKSVHV